MFKQKHLTKLIIIIPIFFIILTASIISFISIYNINKDYETSVYNLETTLLQNEEKNLIPIVDSINSYIKFKKATSINILKNNIKSKISYAEELLLKLSSNNISSTTLQVSLLSHLENKNKTNRGNYFIYSYKSKNDKLLSSTTNSTNINNDLYTNEDFISKFNSLLKEKNEGLILYLDQKEDRLEVSNSSKLAYIKNFDELNIVIGYSIFIKDFEYITKKEIINRLNLMEISKEINIFTLDKNMNYIQNSENRSLINTKFNYFDNSEKNYFFNDYLNKSKVDLQKNKYEFIWKKTTDNKNKLYIFNYIKTWDWLVGITLDIKNIDKEIETELSELKTKKTKLINNIILIALCLIVILSLIYYFFSIQINNLLYEYKQKIESQKNALKNINATLEVKVKDKNNI